MEIFAKITFRVVKKGHINEALFKLIKSQNKFYWSMLSKYYSSKTDYWYFPNRKDLNEIKRIERPIPQYQFSVSKLKTFIPFDHADLLEENLCNS